MRNRLRSSSNPHLRWGAEVELHVKAYENARAVADHKAASAARLALRQAATRLRTAGESWLPASGLHSLVHAAVQCGDLDGAADELLVWYPTVESANVETDSKERGALRLFLASCIRFLECHGSIGHPLEADVVDAMRDIAVQGKDMLSADYEPGVKRVSHLRAKITETERIAEVTRAPLTASSLGMGLELVRGAGWRARSFRSTWSAKRRIRQAETAVVAAKSSSSSQDLMRIVDDLTGLLSESGQRDVTCRWAATVLAEAALVVTEAGGDATVLLGAADRLADVGTARSVAHLLRARTYLATSDAVSADTDGRLRAAMTELRRAAATTDRLTRLLLPEVHAALGWLHVYLDPDAIDSGIEQCRLGRAHGLGLRRGVTTADLTLARLLLRRALRPGTSLEQRVDDIREAARLSRRQYWSRHADVRTHLVLNDALRAWDALADGPNAVVQLGWRNAVRGSADAIPADRSRLAVAWVAWAVGVDHAELAAEAYLHLISLVPLDAASRHMPAERDEVLAAAQEHIEEAGYWLARAGRYRDAVVVLETGRAVTLTETTSRDHTRAADQSGPKVDYEDVIAATGDGAVVYIAAAKAGGYALIVAARHDPQFVELVRFDRASIAELLDSLLPDASRLSPHADQVADGLKWLWENGMRDLLLLHARGPIVTLIPIGLLSLLPLHAVGDRVPDDPDSEWHDAGHFSAIRYAPNARTLRRCRETAELLSPMPLPLIAVDVPDGFEVPRRQRLAFVAHEAAEVVRLWDREVDASRLQHDCTWETFRRVAGDYAVWHLACHGEAFPYSVRGSLLYFADARVTIDDLRAEFSWSHRRLAVLSACQTQLTSIAVPNEVVGLPSALLQLGFAGVIATAWEVDDSATTCLMSYFYRLWRHEQVHPVVALNRAQRWLRGATRADLVALLPELEPGLEAEQPYAHARYWAAYSYTGA